ncbi:hypothetical protein C8R45DRAFT_1087636 [Mycena sanguinolenta]|nr:hypothetical protein C8R45DRAFT_1087636 [Mycena sanguinolenta]
MPKGQFDRIQNDHIESFFPEFTKELDKGLAGAELTRWKQCKAGAILESPLFASLSQKNSRKIWFETIVRKFTNFRNQTYPKLALAAGKASVLPSNADSFFAEQNCDELKVAYQQRMADTKIKSPAAVYQNFGVDREEFCAEYEKAWLEYLDHSISRPIRVNPLIPHNVNGQPVFLSIDVNEIAMRDARTLLSDYLDQCLASHPVSPDTMTRIPWEEVASSPDKFYDTTLFSISLDQPQNLSAIQVITLIQELLATSGIEGSSPFHFSGQEGLVSTSTPEITDAISGSEITDPTCGSEMEITVYKINIFCFGFDYIFTLTCAVARASRIHIHAFFNPGKP